MLIVCFFVFSQAEESELPELPQQEHGGDHTGIIIINVIIIIYYYYYDVFNTLQHMIIRPVQYVSNVVNT